MQQIIYIHGGNLFPDEETFLAFLQQKEYDPFEDKLKKWNYWIKGNLPSTYQMFIPDMPNKTNASYKAWKIWFEKLFPYLNDEKTIL
ncbi:MAG: hypothetical protein LBF15_02575, partial [Candidatus Peribacteria bacterium]|nr:hypothetical protein [Candidatus Peribacteria bacterium]